MSRVFRTLCMCCVRSVNKDSYYYPIPIPIPNHIKNEQQWGLRMLHFWFVQNFQRLIALTDSQFMCPPLIHHHYYFV